MIEETADKTGETVSSTPSVILFFVNDLRYFRDHRRNILEFQINRGRRVHICYGVGAEVASDFTARNVVLHRCRLDPNRFRPVRDAQVAVQFHQLLREVVPDVVHTLTMKPNLYGGLAFAFSTIRKRCGLVQTFPGLGKVFESGTHWLRRSERRLVSIGLRLVARRTKVHAAFENAHDAQFLIKIGAVKETRAHVLPGAGIDFSKYSPNPMPTPQVSSHVHVLFASRPLSAKGVLEFIEAAQAVRRNNEDVSFTIAGDVDSTNADRIDVEAALQQRGLGDSPWMRYCGHVPNAEMPQLLQTADIVCLPTKLREGFPRILIEGAASGACLMASDQPSVRQILREGENGWFVDPRNMPGFIEILEMACSDRERLREFGKASIEIVSRMGVGEEDVAAAFDTIYTMSMPSRSRTDTL
ncbi:MAG: glycosyltransferase [Hyphomonas sp.]|nr:glycosyltransferase [Hyphomonas sp.]